MGSGAEGVGLSFRPMSFRPRVENVVLEKLWGRAGHVTARAGHPARARPAVSTARCFVGCGRNGAQRGVGTLGYRAPPTPCDACRRAIAARAPRWRWRFVSMLVLVSEPRDDDRAEIPPVSPLCGGGRALGLKIEIKADTAAPLR